MSKPREARSSSTGRAFSLPFIMNPSLFQSILQSDLPAWHRLILAVLWYDADEDGKVWQSHDYIAQRSNLSVPTVRKHMRALVANGWLRLSRVGESEVYVIAAPTENETLEEEL